MDPASNLVPDNADMRGEELQRMTSHNNPSGHEDAQLLRPAHEDVNAISYATNPSDSGENVQVPMKRKREVYYEQVCDLM